jgi:hypothetical protein
MRQHTNMKHIPAMKQYALSLQATTGISFLKGRLLHPFRTAVAAFATALLLFTVSPKCLAAGTIVATPPNPFPQGNFSVTATQNLTAPRGRHLCARIQRRCEHKC